MHHLVTGYYITQALAVAAELGLADLLRDGPRSSADLAHATATDTPSLHRLLRVLVAFAVLDEVEPGLFTLTPLGNWLRFDIEGSLRPVARFYGGEYLWRSWGDLLHCVRTGEPAGPHALGASFNEYLAQHLEGLSIVQDAMTTYATATLSGVVASGFGSHGTIVDVGGGQGAMLAAILHAQPELRGSLFDFPQVVRGAALVLEAAGVAPRCDIAGGDALEVVPAGGDLYLLSRVIHGCDDARAIAILRNCRRAVRGPAKLLLVEFVLPARAAHSWSAHTQLLSDLNMLVLGEGGERTEERLPRPPRRVGMGDDTGHPGGRGNEFGRRCRRLNFPVATGVSAIASAWAWRNRHGAHSCWAIGTDRTASRDLQDIRCYGTPRPDPPLRPNQAGDFTTSVPCFDS